MRLFRSTLFIFGVLLLPVVSRSEGSDALRQPPLVIGGIFCLTGEIASGCNAIREGAEVALDLVNQSGGINGRLLRLEIQDSHYSPKESHTLAQRFARNDAILGILITGIVETKAAAAPLEKAKLPYLTLWDSAPAIEELGEFSFGIGPWLPSSYELAAEFAFSSLEAKKAAVVATTAEWSTSVAKGFTDHFTKLGGKVLSFEEALPSDADFRSLLSRVLASKPEVIYAPVTSHIIPFFQQLRQLGYRGPVITSDNLTDDLSAQSRGVFEGVFQTMVADPENPESEKLKDLYQKKFGKPANMLAFHGWGYDGVRLMAEALRNSKLSRVSVRDALLAIKDFPGAGGKITFSAEGSWKMPLKVFKVQDGKLQIVR